MINPFKEVKWKPSVADLGAFARSLVIGFPCVACVLLILGYLAGKGWNFSLAMKVGSLGAAAGLTFLAVPPIAKPFYLVWYFFACCIGLIVGNVLMAAVFYGLVASIGLVRRTFGRAPISKSLDRQAKTYWKDADQPADPERYYRQF